MLDTDIVITVLDWIARGAVLLIAGLLKWVQSLHTRQTRQEEKYEALRNDVDNDNGRRNEERKEVLRAIESTNRKIDEHYSDLMKQLSKMNK